MIHLETLFMSGSDLVLWEKQTQEDMPQNGKIISSWDEFISKIRKQFYPLACTQTTMIEWIHLKQLKGKSIQSYKQKFKKRALSLGISLYTR